MKLKTGLKRSSVGGGNSGNQQQKKGDLQEGVSEKTKDGAPLGEEKEHAPIVKGRGKPGPRVLSPIPGLEPHASCGASSRAAATIQDSLALMTATPTPEDHEEKLGEEAALRLLVQDIFTRKQPDQGTPIDSPTYGMPAATDIQQPAGTDPRDESDHVHATCYA